MLIGLDVRSIQHSLRCRRGIGECGRHLLKHLLSKEGPHKYVVFANKGDWFPESDIFKQAQIHYLKRTRRLSWVEDQICLPFEIRFKKINLFHSLSLNTPFFKAAKTIVSVYDLIPLLYPKQYLPTKSVRLWYALQLKFLGQANRIIVASNHTKKDLIRFMGIPEDKIRVIYPGLNDIYRFPASDEGWPMIQDEFKINKEYVLYVGGFDARKNIPFLISAFKTIKENLDLLLILVGGYSKKEFYIFRLVKELGLERDIIFTGFIDTKKLHLLYKFAKAFVFPSLYEGFGLPLIEAMASGCPVVALRCSSIPEVVADAGALVDPEDKDAFIRAITAVIQGQNLRAQLIERGKIRAGNFSWQKAAKQTLETYSEVINEQ